MKAAGLLVATLVAFGFFAPPHANAAPPLIQIDGSSTVYPVTEAVAEDFQKARRNRVHVTVGISGTGGGFKKFCRGELEVANASRPITQSEVADCRAAGVEFIEIPIAFDALTVVVNPRNDWARSMTIAELKAIWAPAAQGKITRWQQVNPGWPDRQLKLFGPGPDSGTFEYFTRAINGRSRATRADYSASEDDNVLALGVERDAGALGYLGYSYYLENREKLAVVALVAAADKPAIGPSVETVVNGSYQPLTRPLLIYVNAASAERPEVAAFIEFYLKNAEKLAEEVGVIPLPERAYVKGLHQFARRTQGSRFAGEDRIGVGIDALMALKPR